MTSCALLTSKSSLSPSGILGGTRFGIKTLQEGEDEKGESAASTWDRMVPFIQALAYPALLSEPHSPQGCRVSTL